MICRPISKIIIILALISSNGVYAQPINSYQHLRTVIGQHVRDTATVDAMASLSHQLKNFDSAFSYAQQGLSLARSLGYRRGEAHCLIALMDIFASQHNNFIQAIEYGFSAIHIYEKEHDLSGVASTQLMFQGTYREAGDYNNALVHAFAGEQLARTNNIRGNIINFPSQRLTPLFLAEIAQIYIMRNQPDSALYFTNQSIQQNELFNGVEWGFPVYLLATIQELRGDYDEALQNYRLSKTLSIQNGNPDDTLQIFSGMSTMFKNRGDLDSSIYYARIVSSAWKPELSEPKNLFEAVNNLAAVYEKKGNKDSAIRYIKIRLKLQDSLFSQDKMRQLQNISFNQKLKQQELESANAEYKNKLKIYLLAGGSIILLTIAFILWRNNLQRQRAYLLLENQKKEIDFQRSKAEQAVEDLKSTQLQLIQREKMASLGELTAGIAHEIQNPLNFVNNFSEVNSELIAEMNEELAKGNVNEVKNIAKGILENEQKITLHGKRADSIVKGMLQHSRSSSSQKELTDINALADEYLKLSYHGLRAKDSSFNATLQTDFHQMDPIDIVPQDIGRVLLNLFNNAFYAVAEKKKEHPENFEPVVSVSTKQNDNKVELIIKDNGNGIPQKILDKIFQPFFTTKPVGEGTGLGLSLSYEIIKAHGGEIKVNTTDGEGSEFIISLPKSFHV
jgi:signal transduction histidine kinase